MAGNINESFKLIYLKIYGPEKKMWKQLGKKQMQVNKLLQLKTLIIYSNRALFRDCISVISNKSTDNKRSM